MKIKKSLIVMAGAALISVALIAGMTNAWFTDRDTATITEAQAGWLEITLEADEENPVDVIRLYPGDEAVEFGYTLTNESEITVKASVNFTSLFEVYLIEDYFFDNDGFVKKEYRDDLFSNNYDINGMIGQAYIYKNAAPISDYPDQILVSDNTASLGAEFLGFDADGLMWFELAPGDSVNITFGLALDGDKTLNDFQYAAFKNTGDVIALGYQLADPIF